jgi:hypothetical protein
MKELLKKENIVPAKHNPRGHYEHLKPKAFEMLGRDIAYINIARVMGVSEQVIASILNVPERY